jgi:hypothetical protein
MIAPRKLVLIGMTIAASATFSSSIAHAAPAAPVASPARLDAAAAAAPLATPNAWSGGVLHPTYGVSQSSPITVSRAGAPQVVVADSGGKLYSYDRATGALVWSRSLLASSVLAPLSTDNTSIFAGLTQKTATNVTVGSYDVGTGATHWGGNRCAHCMQLGGTAISGTEATMGSAQSHVYGLSATSGGAHWNYLNTDSVNSTPAVADLYGNGSHEWIFTTDQTGNAKVNPPALPGGHLRIFSAQGQEICNANIGGGVQPTGSFDSSPAVVSFGSGSMIVFGTGESNTNAKRLLVFNGACQKIWISPQLAGTTVGAPAIADTEGTGTPVVVEEVADSAGHPVIYKVDIRNQRIIASTTLTACNHFRPGTSSSVVTADLRNSGHQDLVVPAGECGAVILDGQTLTQIGLVGKNCGMQNSPLLTNDGGGRVGITVAGYSAKPGGGMYGCVSHYTVAGASLGTMGWPEFHHDAQLTGVLSQTITSRDGMFTGQSLASGGTLTSTTGPNTLTMQTNGYLAVRNGNGVLLYSSGATPYSGSRLVLTNTTLRLYTAAGRMVRQLWAVGANSRPTHLVVQGDGHVAVYRAGTNAWAADVKLWTS